jgi:phosphate transport system permease protein
MRKAVAILLPAMTGAAALAALTVLGGIVWAITTRAWPALSWSFFTEKIALVGAAGGIFWNLIGTMILAVTALAVSLPIAGGLALLHGCLLQSEAWRERLRLLLYVLNGVPSILFGLFGLMIFVKWLGWGKSWLTGGILLGMMMVPTVAVALSERIAALPARYVEAAHGLGLSRSQVVWSVVMPQCRSGLITGALLGLARGVGETAPIMFTATIFAGATFPKGIVESPVLSLPYHIFNLAQDSFNPEAIAKLWGAALVLLGLVFMLSLAALPMRLRTHDAAHE